VAGAVLLLVAANLIALVHEGSMMSGIPVSQVLPVLPVVLTRTHWGAVWVARTVLLAVLIAVLLIRFSMPLLLLASMAAAVTISLMSHAVDAGNLSLPVAADSLHLISVSLWIGGLVPLRFLTGSVVRTLDDPEKKRWFLYENLRRFSGIATVAVAIILVTGIYNSLLHLPDFASVFAWMTRGSYGEVLRIKHIFVIATVAMGGVSRLIVLPGLKRARSDERLFRVFYLAVALELILSVMTLACAFLLTQETPQVPMRKIW
jgi:putative copper export protein